MKDHRARLGWLPQGSFLGTPEKRLCVGLSWDHDDRIGQTCLHFEWGRLYHALIPGLGFALVLQKMEPSTLCLCQTWTRMNYL